MDAELRRRVAMLRAVLHHFDERPASWTAVEPISAEVVTLRNGLAAIEAAADKQARNDPRGLTEEKAAARARAAALLGSLGNRATPYARKTGDADLRRAVEHTEAEWAKMADETFFARAHDALTRLSDALPKLAPYAVTRDLLADATDAVADARPLAARRDDALAHRKAATDALDDGYTPLVPALDNLDRLVPELLPDPDFVAGYRNARTIEGD